MLTVHSSSNCLRDGQLLHPAFFIVLGVFIGTLNDTMIGSLVASIPSLVLGWCGPIDMCERTLRDDLSTMSRMLMTLCSFCSR